MRLLLIEDEALLGEMMVAGLEAAHYKVDWFRNGTEGFTRASTDGYGVILLDLMVPGMDGWTICQRLRDARVTTPILMLTARDQVEDRIRGLEIGADDYLAKPFDFGELKARIGALLRRSGMQRRRLLQIADLVIDTEARKLTRNGTPISLTPREFDLLVALATREGQTVSKQTILSGVWGSTENSFNAVEAHMAALRRKLDADRPPDAKLFHTVYGNGYVLRDPHQETRDGETTDSSP